VLPVAALLISGGFFKLSGFTHTYMAQYNLGCLSGIIDYLKKIEFGF
jgi:hypothetical protein